MILGDNDNETTLCVHGTQGRSTTAAAPFNFDVGVGDVCVAGVLADNEKNLCIFVSVLFLSLARFFS